jgi:rubrerythrin
MKLQTASSVISFARELEEDSAKFYQELAQRYPQNEDTFLTFAKENKKFVVQTERAYYGVISDAIEGCFAFDLDSEKYTMEIVLTESTEQADAVGKALKMEEMITKFYTDAANQSESLMADVPRTFKLIAKKRGERAAKLESLVSRFS